MIGYGNSMFLATHGILARSASGGVDPDAQAFITAASITDPTQQSAINTLVTDLKGYNIWTKMKAIYPMVGGTSTSTSYNLVNTALYQISWSGGVTWGANGVQFGGVNGYGNTGLNQSSVLSQNSQHISFYSRTNTDANLVDIGLKSVATAYTMLQVKYSNAFVAPINEFYNFADNSANTNSQGFYVGNRTGATVRNNWKNGSKVHTSSSASQTQANFNFFVGAINNAGTAANYTNRQCAFASIGDGLTDTEAANFYTAVQTFQVTLGRSIGTQTVSDADAQAFVTNAGIVDQVEANAINNLVIGLKADGLWTKIYAAYPMVGGTSTSTSYNLKNPAQHQITWVGGVTHASTGVTFNGTNGYGNTNLAANLLPQNSAHMSFYSRTNNTTSGLDMGQNDVANTSYGYLSLYTTSLLKGVITMNNTSPNYLAETTFTNTLGLMIGSRTTSTMVKLFRNTTKTESNSINSTTPQAFNIFIGARNDGGTAANYVNRQCAFASAGTGLNDTDATNLNNRVTTFQTALNRNV